jgi:hypothetical protein
MRDGMRDEGGLDEGGWMRDDGGWMRDDGGWMRDGRVG